MIGYMVLVLSDGVETQKKHWKDFFTSSLVAKHLKGGSALDRAYRYSNGEYESIATEVDGYFIFETDDDDILKELLNLIPVVRSGGKVQVYSLAEDD